MLRSKQTLMDGLEVMTHTPHLTTIRSNVLRSQGRIIGNLSSDTGPVNGTGACSSTLDNPRGLGRAGPGSESIDSFYYKPHIHIRVSGALICSVVNVREKYRADIDM